MKTIHKILFIALLIFPLYITAQTTVNNNKLYTLYYLLDTAATPVNERLFDVISLKDEINFHLKCMCYPWETNPVFSYKKAGKGIIYQHNN